MPTEVENTEKSYIKDFFELSLDLLCVVDFKGKIIDVNPAWSRTLGWSKDEVLKKNYLDFIHPEDQETSKEAAQKLFEAGCVTFFVNRFLCKDGSYKHMRWNASASLEEKTIFAIARDVTAARNRDIMFEELQRAAKIGSWRLDVTTKELQWSDETYRIHEMPVGIPVDCTIGINFYAPEAQPIIAQHLEDCVERAIPYDAELSFITAKGRRIWVKVKGYPVRIINGEVKEVAGTLQDITDAKVLRQQAEKQNQFLEKIIDHLPVALFAKDAKDEFRFTLWNATAENLWGLSKKEILGKNDYDFFPPDQSNSFREKDLEVMRKAQVQEIPEEQLTTPRGERVLHTIKVPLRLENDVEMLLGISLDVTEKKLQQVLLRDEKEKFEGIINHIPIMIAALSPSGKIEWVNNEWEQGLGWKLNAKSNQSLLDTLPDDPEDVVKLEFLLNYKTPRWEEMRIVTRDEKEMWLSLTAVKLSIGKTLVIATDMTEKKQQENVIREQQVRMAMSSKLSSLGEMAAGVAHEINNPLAIIVGRVFQLRLLLEKGEIDNYKFMKGFAQIETTAMRISQIVRGLKAFSRNSEGDPFEAVPVETVVNDTLSFCSERFKNHEIELRVSIEPQLKMSCRPSQISQVVLNLLNNAKDAIADHSEKWISLDVTEDDEFVRISVTDSGLGIPKEIAEKIMEPFYTTKEQGKGTGLGLSISQGIVSEHFGTLYYDADSKNTRFVMLIPKAATAKAAI